MCLDSSVSWPNFENEFYKVVGFHLKIKELEKSKYLRTLCGKALENLVWVERWLSPSGFLRDWVLLLMLEEVVCPLYDSKKVFIHCGFRKVFLHLLCYSREVSSSFVGLKGGVRPLWISRVVLFILNCFYSYL